MSFVMQRTPRFTCQSGGLTAPCDLYRPRRNARPRPVDASAPGLTLVVDIDALDEGWSDWTNGLNGRPAA